MESKGWCGGSFTVEAAFTVPLGFLALMSLCCLFQMIVRQNTIQMAMLRAAQSYSSQGETAVSLEEIAREGTIFLRWKDTRDGKLCYVEDAMGIPFIGSRFFKLNHYQQMEVNAYEGVSMVSDGDDSTMVFVAEHGTVYHLDRECTYLRTRIQQTSVGQAASLRNQSGGKYYPCESCCHSVEQAADAQVYLASYGNRYHISRSCNKLKRTVRRLHLGDVGDLPACSKCG